MSKRALAIAAFVLLSIPSLSIAELRIASWNIQHLGWNNEKSYEAVARIASQFDFIAIQELMNKEGIHRLESTLERKTGESWSAIYSHALGESTYREKYAFLWRDSAVEYAEGAVVYLDKHNKFAREPFSALFRAKDSGVEFVAANVHIVYGRRVSDRTPEIQALRDYWDWLAEVYPEHTTRRMLLGDFNLRPSHVAWMQMRKVAQPLITEGGTTLSTHDRQYANLYDNIWVSLDHDLPITEVGILEFPVLLSETTHHYWSHETARAHVSDHAPVFALFSSARLHDVRYGELHVPNLVAMGEKPTSAEECIDLNRASREMLERLPHIGPGRSDSIVRGRPWRTIDDLSRISGIGGGRLLDIQQSGLVCTL